MKKLILLLLIPIMMQGQTATEKIKAKFKQINDAKIERLKECEELTFFTATTPATLKEHGEWLKEFISLWDEYAKECYADSVLAHTYTPKWNSRCLRQTGNLADGYSFVIDCKDSSHYSYTHKQPDPIEFITIFLRNKLKGE